MLSWFFTIKPATNETKADLLKHRMQYNVSVVISLTITHFKKYDMYKNLKLRMAVSHDPDLSFSFRGIMLNKEYLNRPPYLYWNTLTWYGSLSVLSLEGSVVGRTGFGGHPYNNRPGRARGSRTMSKVKRCNSARATQYCPVLQIARQTIRTFFLHESNWWEAGMVSKLWLNTSSHF